MSRNIVAQLDPIFKPRSIAFIGASNDPTKWGQWLVARALGAGFRGGLYPVNPGKQEVQGLRAYASVLDIPEAVDLAVFTVPAALVPQTMAQCVAKGVRGAVIISAGFAETGEAGRRLQQEVTRIAREGGLRFMGPNCNGLWSAVAKLNLSFHRPPLAGPIAFVSQSGAFGGYLAEVANSKGYGLSTFISVGNQADLTFADYLEYLREDATTKAIALYVEGFQEGRRFLQVAREVVRSKPILVYKAGRTPTGARAMLSHTASLAGSDELFEAVCRQIGLIRAQEAMHLFDMAEALASQPLPRGNRVAIISSTGGQCVVSADACAALGLEVPEIWERDQGELRAELAPHAPPPKNPIDLAGGPRSPLNIARLATKVAQLAYIDALITTTPDGMPQGPPNAAMARESIDAAEIMAALPQKYGKPLITLSRRHMALGLSRPLLSAAGIPNYETPEECARALYALVSYARLRRRFDDTREAVQEVTQGSA